MANNLDVNGFNIKVGVTYSQQEAQQRLTSVLNTLERKSTIQIPVEIDGERFIKTIRTYQDKMKNLVEETSWYNGAGKVFEQTITNITKGTDRAQAKIDSLSVSQQKLNATTHKSISIFQDFTNTFLKMAKFNTINMIYDGLTSSLSNAIKIVEDFNQATTELKKVSDLEGESLKAYSKDLIEYGEAVGRTLTDMVNSATIFKRTGATDEDAAKLAQIAELYRNVADEEITSAEASSFLVSQMKAFNYTADESIHIIDALNKTANEHAVSTNDLQIALSKSAAALATAGNTYEQTIAMVEGATAVMQNNAGTVGNGLRTIAINIANLATASDNFIAANGKVNISLKDERGEIRSTYEILNDLSQSWSKLSKAEQNEIAVSLSGKTRYNVLTSLMRNFSDAQQTLADALDSTNSAWNENARYMESIASKHARIQAEIQKFVLGDGGLEDLEKKLLDIGIATMQFINNIGGLQTILTAIITMLTVGLIPAGATLLTNIGSMVSSIGVLATNFITAYKSGYSFSMALDAIGVSGITATTAVQGLVAVIGLAIIAFNAYQQAQEQAKEAAHDTNEETIEQADLIQQQILKLKEENQSRQDLIQAIQGVDSAYKDEGQTLDELNQKRQESIDKLNEEREAKLKDAKESGQAQYLKDKKTLSKTYEPSQQLKVEAGYYGITLRTDGIENYINSLKELRIAENKVNVDTSHLNKVIESLETEFEDAQNGVSNYDEILYQLGAKYDDTTGKIVGLSQKEWAEKQAAEEALNVKEKAIGMFAELGVNIEEVQNVLDEDALNDFFDAVNNQDIESATAILEQYGIEVQNVGNSSQESESAISSFLSTANNLQSAYETLNKAAEEYNKQGYLSASTLKQLAKLQPEYLAQLELTGEKATVLNGALQNQFEIEKKLALIHIQTAEQLDIVAYCQEYLGEETDKTTNALANDVINAQALTTAYGQLTNAGYQAADAIATVRAEGRDDDAFYAGLEERRKRWKDYYNEVSAIELDYTNNSKSNASSSKDAWVEAFKEEQRQLKHALEMNEITESEYYEKLKDLNEKYYGEISGKHKKYLKEYQENEEEIYKGLKSIYDKVSDYLAEAVEKGYEKAIKALQKEEKKVLVEIKNNITAIKKERTSVVDGIKDEIEALKKERKSAIDGIQDETNALKKERESIIDGIKDEIDALKKEKKYTLDSIEQETDALKKQKEETEKYWNDQINAIKLENQTLEEQNQLLEYQQALQQAKSQKVMVFQDGKFQLGENESAVSEAEQNLSNYQNQLSYEQQIQQLEDLRDAELQTLSDRIDALEEHKSYMEDYYDGRIEALEEYKSNMEEYYDEQMATLEENKAYLENYYDSRIESLEEYKSYMEKYYDEQIQKMEDYYNQTQEQYDKQVEALQGELDAFKEGYKKQEQLENARLTAQVLGMKQRADIYKEELSNLKDYINQVNAMLAKLGKKGAKVDYSYTPATGAFENISTADVDTQIVRKASGDSSFNQDAIALVGESPNAELVLGSRINSLGGGALMNLSKGSGVVNAESTSTLAGLLNTLGKPSVANNNRTTQQNFNFGSISLPNVTNADTFVNTLSNKFNNYTLQYGNTYK